MMLTSPGFFFKEANLFRLTMSSVARTQDPWITSQTLYHWATQDPRSNFDLNYISGSILLLSVAWLAPDKNQSVESAGVTFVKGANVMNSWFEEKKK